MNLESCKVLPSTGIELGQVYQKTYKGVCGGQTGREGPNVALFALQNTILHLPLSELGIRFVNRMERTVLMNMPVGSEAHTLP